MRGNSLRTAAAVGAALLAAVLLTGGTSADAAQASRASPPALEMTQVEGTPAVPSVGYLDAMWAMVAEVAPTAVQPQVPVVRLITAEEAAAVTAGCLREEGFVDAMATLDGGLEPGVEASAAPERYFVALYVCAARYPIAESLIFG
ncbi:MAG: hypothetical protein JWQ43_3433 [Glaciihabitans sp.]|nr:hypothetical protein [Glaciihabitans sp.]